MSRSPSLSARDAEHPPSESTPLLSRTQSNGGIVERDENESQAAIKSKRRWPSFIALGLLSIAMVAIMFVGFFVPQAMQQYAVQAATIDVESVVPEFTATGARARIRATFSLRSLRVEDSLIRRVGILGTWIASEVEMGESQLRVTLPDYGDAFLGKAQIPPIKVNVRNGHKTYLDFAADLEPPSSADGIRYLADDWLKGLLDHLTVMGEADVNIRSGIIRLPSQTIRQAVTIQGHDIPAIPEFNITRLNFHEAELPNSVKGMAADASITIRNDFPVDLELPPLDFTILVPNCLPTDPHIRLADTRIQDVHIHPKEDVQVNATGFVRELPASLTVECPQSGKSPLDLLLSGYMHGQDTTIYVQGSNDQSPDTPKWISDILSDIVVPVPFAGHAFGNLIKSFSLTDVHFSLPDPFADPDSQESKPTISAMIKALITLPEEMNFSVDVERVRANADIFYKKRKFGELNLLKWQKANSTRIEGSGSEKPLLLVESSIVDAPLDITDEDIFTEVVQALIFGGKAVVLTIEADVDVEVDTALGIMTIRQIPAEGKVPVQPIPGGGLKSFDPKIQNMTIIETTKDAITLEANVSFMNPTQYSATVPFVDINILSNGTFMGHATVENIKVIRGKNENILIQAVWSPKHGERSISRELLSQYISGLNVTLTVQTHKGTIPTRPTLGKALERLNITIPAPRLSFPKNPDSGDGGGDDGDEEGDKRPAFIQEATMHLFSSTADFVLLSPLAKTVIYMTYINATAYYKEDDVGSIFYDLPFAIPPGRSVSPRLPVDWSLGSVGYEAVQKALGGTLKLQAIAKVGIRIGEWEEKIWYRGGGIGAHVRL